MRAFDFSVGLCLKFSGSIQHRKSFKIRGRGISLDNWQWRGYWRSNVCSRQELTFWHCAPNHVVLIIKSFRHQSWGGRLHWNSTPHTVSFSFASFTAGHLKRKDGLCKRLTHVWECFSFLLQHKIFLLIKGKPMFFQNWTINSDVSSFWLKYFVSIRAVITLAPCSGWEAQIILDINEKTPSVERRGLQNYLLCLQITNLFKMTQGPSKFKAHRSDAGPYKSVSPASTTGLHVWGCAWRGCPRCPWLVWLPLPCCDDTKTTTRIWEAPDGTGSYLRATVGEFTLQTQKRFSM